MVRGRDQAVSACTDEIRRSFAARLAALYHRHNGTHPRAGP
jgi:hypothetical protein